MACYGHDPVGFLCSDLAANLRTYALVNPFPATETNV